jgi:hypothetical protein
MSGGPVPVVRIGRDPSLELVSPSPLASRDTRGLITSDEWEGLAITPPLSAAGLARNRDAGCAADD